MEHGVAGAGWLAGLQGSSLGHAMRGSLWLYPLVETLHVIGIAILVGAIVTFDLRLLRPRPELDLAGWSRAVLPVARAGFGLAVPMGLLLFTVEATAYARNPMFLAKLTLLALALGNIWLFHHLAARTSAVTAPLRALAGISLVLWLLIVTCGRLIAYL